MANKNMNEVPWHDDLVFRGPLAPDYPAAIEGRGNVLEWFSGVCPALGQVEVVEHLLSIELTSIATRANVHVGTGVLRVIDRFVVDGDGRIVEQENHYDPRPALGPPPGAMSDEERGLVTTMLEDSRDAFASAVAAIGEDGWTRKPSDGGWSPAECAEHVAVCEDVLMNLLRGKILQSTAAPERVVDVQGKDGVVTQAIRDRSRKIQTFDFLEPSGRFASRRELMEAFLRKRSELLRYVRTTNDSVHHHFSDHGAFGALSAYQWLLLIAGHTERHVAKMFEAAG